MGIGSGPATGGIVAGGIDYTRPAIGINNVTGQRFEVSGGGAGFMQNAYNTVNQQLSDRYGMGGQQGYGGSTGMGSFQPSMSGQSYQSYQTPWGTMNAGFGPQSTGGGSNFPAGIPQPGVPRSTNTQQSWSNGTPGMPGTGGGLQAGGGGLDINALLAKQQAQNDQARVRNQGAFDQSAANIRGVTKQYNDPNSQMGQTVQSTRALVQKLLGNPEALNDNVQAQIQARAQNQIRAKQEEQQRLMTNQMMQSGQGDMASLQAGRERLGNQAAAESQRTATGLDIQRANQRNQDYMNAANAGQQFTQQDMNANLAPESTVLQNMLYQMPDDYAGLIGALGQYNYGQAAQNGFGMSQGGAQNYAYDQMFGSPLMTKMGSYGGGSASTVPGMNPFAQPAYTGGSGYTNQQAQGGGGLARPVFAQGSNIAGRTDTPGPYTGQQIYADMKQNRAGTPGYSYDGRPLNGGSGGAIDSSDWQTEMGAYGDQAMYDRSNPYAGMTSTEAGQSLRPYDGFAAAQNRLNQGAKW